jgi:methylmalonyl-CoA mutase C-terminal domain/subunit
MAPPIRVLIAKPGLDGHDRGARVVALALRQAGFEVIYTGLHQTVEQIVEAALQEDVQVIGLSILSGAHRSIVARLMERLASVGLRPIVLVGGVIPAQDVEPLRAFGVDEVFPTGSSFEAIAAFIRQRHAQRREDERLEARRPS